MLTSQIKKFRNRFRNYLFKYKNGFFELPYLANSPEATLDSFKSMPFIKAFPEKYLTETNSIFVKGQFYNFEIEEGFWIYASSVYYKKNVHFRLIYDPEIPANYFALSYNNVQEFDKINISLVNGMAYSKSSWNLLKPKSVQHLSNYKNTLVKSVGLYVNEDWVAKNIANRTDFLNSNFYTFFSNKADVISLCDFKAEENSFQKQVMDVFENTNKINIETELPKIAHNFLLFLFDNYPINHIDFANSGVSSDTLIKLKEVEEILLDNLLKDFPTIALLSRKTKISETKLKASFKAVYGVSLYQFYLNQRMTLAKTYLENKKMTITQIATILGYDNKSKFSIAFKKQFGCLPSEVKVAK